MKEKKQKKKWIRFRHKVITEIVRVVLTPYIYLTYGIQIKKFKEQGKRNYLVLLNHQTPFDQFFVGIAFKGPVYYVATEDIFSLGWISDVIRWIIAPIPIRKQTTDINAVMNCIRVAREGGTIAMAPEGNRTYSGKTEYMNPAVAGLAKKMKLPIALFRIEGGYGAEPRWTDKIRKGPIKAYISRVIEPEEYAAMSNEELVKIIAEGLHVDEAVEGGPYKSKRKAEYLERAVYYCPDCGFSKWESHGNEITCCTCGKTIAYGENKVLSGVGCDFPYRFVNDWYEAQENYVNQLDVTQLTAEPLFRDEAKMSEVIVYKRKELLREKTQIALYGDRVVFDEGKENEMVVSFADADAVTVLGKNKLNIYFDKHVYQLKGDKRFNALKYVHFCYRCKNILRGEPDDQFLGI